MASIPSKKQFDALQEITQRMQQTCMDTAFWCPEPLLNLIVPGSLADTMKNAASHLKKIIGTSAFKKWVKATKFKEDAVPYIGSNGDYSFFRPTCVTGTQLEGEEGSFGPEEIREHGCWWLLLAFHDPAWLSQDCSEVFKYLVVPDTYLEWQYFEYCDEDGDTAQTVTRNGAHVVMYRGELQLIWTEHGANLLRNVSLCGINYASVVRR